MPSFLRGRRAAAGLLLIVGLSYPLVVYTGLQWLPPSVIVVGLIALLGLRLATRSTSGPFRVAACIAAGTSVVIVAISPLGGVRLYPVVLSLALAGVFAFSLLHPPSVIERVARLREPELSPAGVTYTRKVTTVWLAFFLVNAAIAGWTAAQEGLELWTLYNGLLSYLLAGTLLFGEMLVRRRARGFL